MKFVIIGGILIVLTILMVSCCLALKKVNHGLKQLYGDF